MLAKQEPRSNLGRCGSSSTYGSTGSLGEVSDVIIPIPEAAELQGGVEPGRTQQDSGWSSWNGSFPTGDVQKAKKSQVSRVGFHSDLLIPSVLFENSGFFPLNFIWLGLKPSSLPELRDCFNTEKNRFQKSVFTEYSSTCWRKIDIERSVLIAVSENIP